MTPESIPGAVVPPSDVSSFPMSPSESLPSEPPLFEAPPSPEVIAQSTEAVGRAIMDQAADNRSRACRHGGP